MLLRPIKILTILLAWKAQDSNSIRKYEFPSGPWPKQVQCVGFFDDPEEAARAYDQAALQFRGDKAVTNFPRDDYEETSSAQPAAPDDEPEEVQSSCPGLF